MTPTQRTLQELRRLGYTAAVVERWNAHAGVRQDLWGWADVLAYNDTEILAIQVCTATDLSRRRRKLLQNPHLQTWLRHSARKAEIWVCRKKRAVRGGKRMVWIIQRYPMSR